jgi:hypothetical protein
MPLYTFLHNLLNDSVEIANKIGLQKKIKWDRKSVVVDRAPEPQELLERQTESQ